MTPNIEDSTTEELFQSDYDGAWKEAFHSYLPEFMGRFFPQLAGLIDWTCDVTWFDKEVSQILGQPGRRNREVDLLFNARLLDGTRRWVLCHLEIQTSYQPDFEFRADLYNGGLKWHFRQDVITLAVLADINADWRPSEYRFELGGFGSHRWFPICKLLDHVNSDWATDISLPVQVARAQIAALQTAGDPQARYSAKTKLVRNLYKLGYNKDELREIFRLLDWMMQLPSELSRRFDTELFAYEKEMNMPYVTSVERNAEARGIEKGREEGGTIVLKRPLARVCGPLPTDVEARVAQLSIEQLQVLGESLLDFRSLEDLTNWLATVESRRD